MARLVLLVNFILFSLTLVAASESSDADISSSNAEISMFPNSSSAAGSPSPSGSKSDLASSAVSSSNSSDSTVFNSRKKPRAYCPKGKKKSSCPKHEVRIKCINTYCKPQKCSDRGRAIPCPAIAGRCEKGCVCASGYLRNSRGRCIPENKCPPVCPANEEFSNCTQDICRQQTCKDKKMPLSCQAIKEGDCNSGCVCQSGYLRTPEGECVPQNQCSGDLVCKTNEVVANCPNSGHGDCCPKSEKDAKSRKQSKVITECEEQSCTCRFNYMRADNGTCIPARDCPPFDCTGENEEFNPCPPLCPTDDCAQATPSGRCPLFGNIGIVLQCKADCRCKRGFWRKNGVCVPYSECPGKCPLNEEYSDCIQGVCRAQNCAQKGKPIICAGIAEGCCEKGCICSPGFLRDELGNCVPDDQCPVCPANEEFSNCTQAVCRQQTCKDKKMPLSCQAINEGDCNSGCVCQSGYLRTPEGECVPQNQCSGDLVCKTNEVVANCPNSGHGDYCPKSEKDAKSRKRSKVITECEEQSCTCRFNYMRADNGTCIPARDCPPFNCTGENEEFNPCPPLCPTDDCAQATPSGRCPLFGRIGIVLQCKADCRCKSGFWRKNGVCVPYSECPVKCPLNEEYSDCIQGVCRAQNCTQKGKPIICAGIAEGSCEKGCICSPGFLRDELGNCVPDDQCPVPKCAGQNEVLAECANACDPINCPESFQAEKERLADCVSIAACLRDCRCRPDYRRDEEGTCIPIGECPGICQANEELSNCTQALCRAQNCTEKERPIACPGIAKDSCEKGCVCSTGFLRNSEGNCVPEDQCPVCRSNDDSRKCPTNERYSTCIQGECRALNCTQKGKPIACPRLAPGACRNGCVCVEGTLRAANGSCIPEKECPVCPANEEFSNCTEAICRQQTCKDKIMPLSCPAIKAGDCNSGCVCQSGYLRTPEGECVAQNQCSGDLVCKTNEVVANCPNSGHGDCCPKSEKDAKSRKQSKVITECEEQSCTCRFNYVRADNGTCIPARDCPPFDCTGENEEFNPCPPLCPTDDCAQATPSGRCPLPGRIGIVLQCKADCRCKSGFWRKNGVCVPYSECPGICSLNEEYSDCIQGVCRAQNCTQKGKPIACEGMAEGSCEKGCICSPGFLRDELGNCVPDDQCQAHGNRLSVLRGIDRGIDRLGGG